MSDLQVFSNSRLNVWHSCQTLHDYVYKHGKLAGENKNMRKGVYIHEMLEMGYEYLLRFNEGMFRQLPDDVLNLICVPNYDEDDLELRIEAGRIVRDYFNLFAPYNDLRIQVLAVEEKIQVPLTTPKGRQVAIIMYIDLIYRSIDDGRLYIMDHKSGKMLTKDEISFMAQQHLYVTMMRTHGYPVTDSVINNLYGTYPKIAKGIYDRFKRFPVGIDEVKGQAAYRNTGRIIDEIIDHQEQPKSTYMQMDQGCAYCAFRMVCDLRIRGKLAEAREVLTSYRDKEDSVELRKRDRTVLVERIRNRNFFRPAPVPAPVDSAPVFEVEDD